ncbi:terpenoid cyclases/protein prenyltransferase alpha-alpha toroid [Bisporella sp. PMI_857]|nr:terpenoid cyclases/protein prenyltransferase alpha-alpha toroid [Bisporella sp. PMI_857]
MPFLIKGKKNRQNVVFQRRAMAEQVPSSSPSFSNNLPYRNRETPQSGFVVEDFSGSEDTDSQDDFVVSTGPRSTFEISAATAYASMIPDLFKTLPPLKDNLGTQTSRIQDKTIQECLPFLAGEKSELRYNDHGIPHLDKNRHIAFLHNALKKLPAAYVAADASRPWMFYWSLAGLSILGEDISGYRDKLISTMSHLAPTYAILLSLIMVGGEAALDVIDRKSMWKWLGALKQPDGGFQMSVGGEADVRGAYCAAVIISLLNLPLDLPRDSPAWSEKGATLLTNLPEYVARPNIRGGISGKPDAEAHGAYAFCALACLCLIGEPHVIIPLYLDVPRLISWLSARQYAPEGGFAGRTNKLVDGCYSHWVGGCWPLVEACIEGLTLSNREDEDQTNLEKSSGPDGDLYSREGLIRYILCCCQDTSFFSKSDAYHTCYVLAGLSSAQHKWHFDTKISKMSSLGGLISAYQWSAESVMKETQAYDEEDRVNTIHPTREYFTLKGGF